MTPTITQEAAARSLRRPARVAVFVGTVLALIALALLPLLTPWFTHAALDAAGSAERLGVDTAIAHALSDASVEALVVSGRFELSGPDGQPFYDAAERSHLSDARVLLWIFLVAGGLSLIAIAALYARKDHRGRSAIWRTVARAGLVTAVVVLALGLVSTVAFGPLFTLFHQVFFPAGNWSFDPATQRLVQLYPFGFWQVASGALGVLVLLLGSGAWLLGRHLAGRTEAAA